MVTNYTEMAKASDYFNPVCFTRFFNDKLKLKKEGGLDGLTPSTFWKHYAKELDDISSRCLNGTYKFSAYKEKLILKGKDKFPRVLSMEQRGETSGGMPLYQRDSRTIPQSSWHEVEADGLDARDTI